MIIPVSAKVRQVVDVVDRQDMSLIEVRRAIVKCLVGTTVTYITSVVIFRVIKSLRPGVGQAILEATRIAPVHLNL